MKSAAELREEYLELLDKEEREQIYQDFIEKNTRLVPRDFVQNHGVHLSLILRKLRFGADYISDLFFLSKSSDDWNAVCVELEKPSSRFFKDGSNDLHADFVSALQQVKRWEAWFLDNDNCAAFLNQISTIRVPEIMKRNPTFMKYVLVFGRRAEYEGNEIRRRIIASHETSSFKIMTYDSLAEDIESKQDLYIGVRRNEFIDIKSDEIVNDNLFVWVDPTLLTVGKMLHEKLELACAQNSSDRKSGISMADFHPDALKVKIKSQK